MRWCSSSWTTRSNWFRARWRSCARGRDASQLQSRDALGHYKILDRIGAGRIGELYRGRDTRGGRTVAIRVLAADIADNPSDRDRFLHDARAITALSHPNIAALYEIGQDDGRVFLVAEYVPGESLKNAIAGRALNPRRALEHALQLADALGEAHAVGFHHLDISPDSIVITPKGHAKFLDFGLSAWTASGLERKELPARLASQMEIGSRVLPYMSPEQISGTAVDERTDVFSLGVVMYEMVTGKTPFTDAAPTLIAQQIVHGRAAPPSTVNRALPPELDAIVLRALAARVDERYQAVPTLAAELRSVVAMLDLRREALDAKALRVGRDRRVDAIGPSRRPLLSWLVWLLVIAVLAGILWVGVTRLGPRLG